MKNKKHSPATNKPQDSKNAVHNTSGAVMPDAQRRSAQSEKEVQAAFGSDSKNSKRNR